MSPRALYKPVCALSLRWVVTACLLLFVCYCCLRCLLTRVVKINVKQMVVEVEDELEDVSISDIADELPEFQPRFIAYRYLLMFHAV